MPKFARSDASKVRPASRGWVRVLTLAATAGLLGAGPALGAGAVADEPPPSPPAKVTSKAASTQVIVRHRLGQGDAARAAVKSAGGTVLLDLGIIGAFTASVPKSAVPSLQKSSSILALTTDPLLTLKTDRWRADKDENSLYSIADTNGATDAWNLYKATGKGVGVALIDSGIAPVEGLNTAGKVINGPDLSFDSQSAPLRYVDTFGHGTHMAGIIAGRDSDVLPGKEGTKKSFVGIAPDAHLVNVKAASADGATDVSQVIAGIDWVVTHRNDPGLNIKVLSLSYGTASTQSAQLDPLSYAVEAAWKAGITVVVSGGNDGTAATSLTMPAANPYVLAVGAVDPVATSKTSDDVVAEFSNRGNATRHADLLASGRSVVSLRDPGSYIDQNYPEGLITGDTAKRFFRGSGTSQATAVTAGAVALLLQQRPTLTPDQVKALLVGSAAPLATAGTDRIGQGAGQLDIAAALKLATPATAKQTWPAASGLGSLETSRGGSHVADPTTGAELTGEVDALGGKWTPATWASLSKSGTAWSGGTWNGNTWTGSAFNGASWSGKTWGSATWTGQSWSGRSWSGRSWSDAVWTGRSWSGRSWSGSEWAGRSWSGRSWSGGAWK
jgi:serine protease AprX